MPFYAILRSIPSKTLGILAMAAALLALPLLPLEQRAVAVGGLSPALLPLTWCERERSLLTLRRRRADLVALLAAVFLTLGFVGSRPVAEPYLSGGQLLVVLYFGLLAALALPALRRPGGGAPAEASGPLCWPWPSATWPSAPCLPPEPCWPPAGGWGFGGPPPCWGPWPWGSC